MQLLLSAGIKIKQPGEFGEPHPSKLWCEHLKHKVSAWSGLTVAR